MIINNTIKIYCIPSNARKIDYILKRKCFALGSGIGDKGGVYLIFDADDLNPLLEDWNNKIKTERVM